MTNITPSIHPFPLNVCRFVYFRGQRQAQCRQTRAVRAKDNRNKTENRWRRRMKQNQRRSMERRDKHTAFYGFTDEKFIHDGSAIDARRRCRRLGWGRRSSVAWQSVVGALPSRRACSELWPGPRVGQGSRPAIRLTDVQLAIFNDRCSTIPRRSAKNRDRSRSPVSLNVRRT